MKKILFIKTITILVLVFLSSGVLAIEYKPYTPGDIDAKISCAVTIAKAEFIVGKLGVFGTPKICHGVKESELTKWKCINIKLDNNVSFAQATDACIEQTSSK